MAMMPDTSASDKEAAKPECGSVFFTHVVQSRAARSRCFLLCRGTSVRSCQSESNDLQWRCFKGFSSGRCLFDLRRPSPSERNGWTKVFSLSRLSAL
jgi:hypothetical protein